jgi:hypothetical protein
VIRIHCWITLAALTLAGGSAQAQFYGGGYWGGGYGGYGGAGSTAQGSILQGQSMYAMGMGRYNVETAQARSINSNTAMRWNQYMYQSQLESNRIYHEHEQAKQARGKADYKAIKDRLRDNPTSADIASGAALNRAMEELVNPKVFEKAVYYGHKMKIGGDSIRKIPFQYASAGISASAYQLTHGGAPKVIKEDEKFAADREKLRALAAEIRKEGEELGSPKPETIKRAKEQLMATKAKVEASFPQSSQERRDALTYIKALFGLASMLETPAISVLLAGVENRPEATVGDLLGFMTAYNLRFGASDNATQREIYVALYPMLKKLRDDVATGLSPDASVTPESLANTPGEVFGGLDFNHAEKTFVPPAPAPK